MEKSLVVTTTDIQKAIEFAAKKFNISEKDIDFELQKVETFIKKDKKSSFEPLLKTHAEILKSKEQLLNPELAFKQSYKVLLTEKKAHNFFLDIALEVDASKTKARAKILPSSKFPPKEELKKWLNYELNKFKARHGIFLVIFDWNMKEEIDKLIALLSKQEKLNKPVSLQISNWSPPAKLTIDDKMIFYYKEPQKNTKNAKRVDHAQREYSNFIQKEVLLAEYIKPQEGVTGRDFTGKLVVAKEPVVKNEPMFNTDESSITVKEDEKSIKYFSKKEGYVIFNDGEFKIDDQLQVDSISLKNTGNISSNLEKDISITIKGDATEDKVGPNMKVEVSSLNIGGSIAEGAEIKSKSLIIGGQTHATSKIYTQTAEIKVHKGYLEAKNAKISALEGGEVFADEIEIDMAINAKIHGKKIHIKELKAHCQIEFCDSLTIDKLSGEENTIITTPTAVKENEIRLDELILKIEKYKKQLPNMQKEFDQTTDKANKNKSNLSQLERAINEYKKSGIQPSAMVLKRYNELLEIEKEAQEKSKILEELKETLAKSNEELKSFQDMVLSAKIHINDLWKGFNEIFFYSIVPKKIIKYSPYSGSGMEEIYLSLTEDDDFEVIKKTLQEKEPEQNNQEANNQEEIVDITGKEENADDNK